MAKRKRSSETVAAVVDHNLLTRLLAVEAWIKSRDDTFSPGVIR